MKKSVNYLQMTNNPIKVSKLFTKTEIHYRSHKELACILIKKK